jgi:uncharacterized protein YkwD
MRSRFLSLALAGAALMLPRTASSAETPDVPQVVERVIAGTNAFRASEGAGRLTVEPHLARAANDFAHVLARTQNLSHSAGGSDLVARARAHGYDYCLVLENIGYQWNTRGFSTEKLAREIVQGWKDSSGHRRNMLDPRVTQVGVAVAHSSANGYYYAVQIFGRPRADCMGNRR